MKLAYSLGMDTYHLFSSRIRQVTVTLLLTLVVCSSSRMTTIAAGPDQASRMDAFAKAAMEFGVPEAILLSLSYNESHWEMNQGTVSADGGYGLTDLRAAVPVDPDPLHTSLTVNYPTLNRAAALLNEPQDVFKADELQNVRGAAAVLADDARHLNGGTPPASSNDWYASLAEFSGADSQSLASQFADEVYATIQSGASRTTFDGKVMLLPADPTVEPSTKNLSGLTFFTPSVPSNGTANTDCPPTITCHLSPATYKQNNPKDPTDYGDYDIAARPSDMKINYIIIHNTEGSYTSAIRHFQDPTSYVSANYVIRSSDGDVTETVPPQDVSWGAGDWYVNMHAINIEHEGFAADGATWYTDQMYRSSAKLVRYLAQKYNIPLDRQHILGHDNVPGTTVSNQAKQHWDPGAYWDWNRYMELLNAPIENGPAVTGASTIVTIAPHFAINQPLITGCTSASAACANQPSNTVYLHTQPANDSPLINDPTMHPSGSAGSTAISDWSSTASTGNSFAIAEQRGDWTAIWFGGVEGWFYNPQGSNLIAHANSGMLITPKAGLTSIPVYGQAYPEATAYPKSIPAMKISPIYNIPVGQSYVTSGTVPTDYFYSQAIDASVPSDHTVVVGKDIYYQITFNHRQAYVKASDITVVRN